MRASEILRREYGSARNFMTPVRVRVGKLSLDRAYELSTGEGFNRQQLWGVSVVRLLSDGTTERVVAESGCYSTRAQAEAHIESLRARSFLADHVAFVSVGDPL